MSYHVFFCLARCETFSRYGGECGRDASLILWGARERWQSVANAAASAAGGWGLCGGVLLRHKSPTAPTRRKRMATAFDPQRRRGQLHKNSRPPSPPELREGSEAQAPGVPAGTERR
jgi:hypothetical protein